MITNHPQRVRQVRLCPKMLSAMLLNNGTYTFVSYLPHDAELKLAGFEPAGFFFFYVYEHPSFAMVKAGETVPIVAADQFFIQRRMPDVEFAGTIK